MISLENAKRLKELGVENPLNDADMFWDGVEEEDRFVGDYYDAEYGQGYNPEEDIWLPTLSQLLEEVEKRGKRWQVGFNSHFYWVDILYYDDIDASHIADTPEDAVALALIAILEVSCTA